MKDKTQDFTIRGVAYLIDDGRHAHYITFRITNNDFIPKNLKYIYI